MADDDELVTKPFKFVTGMFPCLLSTRPVFVAYLSRADS